MDKPDHLDDNRKRNKSGIKVLDLLRSDLQLSFLMVRFMITIVTLAFSSSVSQENNLPVVGHRLEVRGGGP